MTVENYPPIELVRQCLREENGRLFWLHRPREHFATKRACSTWNARFANKEAGVARSGERSERRWAVAIGGVRILRHVIIWAMCVGEWRNGIDHKNRNYLDDRIENLRIATQSQNNANSTLRSDNSSGYKGVSWDKANDKWSVCISVNGRHIRVGRFIDIEEARLAYLDAARRYFGEFACDGK